MAAKVKGKSRRLFVSPQTYVTQIEHDGRRVEGLICKDASDVSGGAVKLNADFFVLAANPIESAGFSLIPVWQKAGLLRVDT